MLVFVVFVGKVFDMIFICLDGVFFRMFCLMCEYVCFEIFEYFFVVGMGVVLFFFGFIVRFEVSGRWRDEVV